VVSRQTISQALRSGNRDAVEAIARDLADEIDRCANLRDRLPVVRAFLVAVAALESMTAAAHRRARDNAATPRQDDGGALDELLRKREAKRGRLRA
jgi:hypothetical protein